MIQQNIMDIVNAARRFNPNIGYYERHIDNFETMGISVLLANPAGTIQIDRMYPQKDVSHLSDEQLKSIAATLNLLE